MPATEPVRHAPGETPAIPRLTILGTRVASVTYAEAVASILSRAREQKAGAYVCAVNVHCVSMARRDPVYRRALNGAFLTVPDGMPLVWAHRILKGRRLTDRVYGPTLMLELCAAAALAGLPIYLYGGGAGVADKLASILTLKFPGLRIAGTCTPPFRERAADDPELLREIEAINASGARLVFVALGAPKQELFMARHAADMLSVQIGVGAAFNFHAGIVPQAPAWMQRAGLEWVYRLICEPRRLWKRYLIYNPYFVARLALQKMGFDRISDAE